MQRRAFTGLCGSLLAAAALQPTSALATHPASLYTASRLVDADGRPLLAAAVAEETPLVFHYPYVTTPCFLLRLPSTDATGELVAYSAICSHKMTHPARPISHISYRPDTVRFRDRHGQPQARQAVISCCSERSVYDARDGARVLAGPARQPLPRILLEIDEHDRIHATGSVGPDRYQQFLDTFGFRLAMEHGVTDVRARTGHETLALPADRYSRQQVRC